MASGEKRRQQQGGLGYIGNGCWGRGLSQQLPGRKEGNMKGAQASWVVAVGGGGGV
jgi:hypothetical protein